MIPYNGYISGAALSHVLCNLLEEVKIPSFTYLATNTLLKTRPTRDKKSIIKLELLVHIWIQLRP
jgi:hypothetical protein